MKTFINTLWILSCLTSATGFAAEYAGSLPGQITPDQGGSANYSIPITVVPGINEMQPNLSLNYRSGNGSDGYLGLGWSLSGLSAITRSGTNDFLEKTYSERQDYDSTEFYHIGVNFDSGDRFRLDGQRLVMITGQTYGENAAIYSKEFEDFSTTTSYGSIGGGPQYFVVQTKDGKTLYYGNTADSRLARSSAVGEPIVTWALNEIQDNWGNSMKISYTADSATGELYPAKLEYTFNTGEGVTTPQGKVEFVYEAKSNISYELIQYWYDNGIQRAIDQRLSEIKIYEGSLLVRKYVLSHIKSPDTKRMLLNKVQLFTGTGDSFPETVFSYETLAFKSFIQMPTGGNRFIGDWEDSNQEFPDYQLGDINGDGQPEFFKFIDDELEVYEFDQARTGSRSARTISPVVSGYSLPVQEDRSLLGDFNGDGKTDILVVGVSGGIQWNLSEYVDNIPPYWDLYYLYTESFNLHISTGSGFLDSETSSFSEYWDYNYHRHQYDSDKSFHPQSKPVAVDVNGDGLTDIYVQRENYVDTLYLSRVDENGDHHFVESSYASLGNDWVLSSFGNANGDGNQDFLSGRKSTVTNRFYVTIYESTGLGFQGAFTINLESLYDQMQILYGDINADGLTDLLYIYKDGNYFKIKPYIASGSMDQNHFQAGTIMSLYFTGNLYTDIRFNLGEFNGDGRADLLVTKKNGSNTAFTVYPSRGLFYTLSWYWSSSIDFVWDEDNSWIPADLDGDGLTDIMSIFESGTSAKVDTWFFYGTGNPSNADSALVPDLLVQAVNGMGQKTQVKYLAGTRSDVHLIDWQSSPQPNWPETYVVAPIPLVAQIQIETGDGDGSSPVWNRSQFTYANALAHTLGYGFLGFQKFISYDETNDIWQDELVYQTFPYAGMSNSKWVSVPNPDENASTAYTSAGVTGNSQMDVKIFNGGKTYFPYVKQSYSTDYAVNYAVNDDDDDDDDEAFSQISTQVITNYYDDYGNPTYLLTQHYLDGINQGRIETWNDYTLNTTFNTNPEYARLKQATVMKSRPGVSNQIRTSSFSYYVNGALKSETIEPGGGNAFELSTEYSYDGFGNVVSKAVTGWNGTSAETRTSYFSYTPGTGRYLVTTTNALGQQSTVISRESGFGFPTQVKDVNNLTAETEYDSFGRVEKSISPDGSFETTTYALASQGGSLNDGRHFATWIKKEFQNDAGGTPINLSPFSKTYLDRAGREIRKETQGKDNGILKSVYIDTLFNDKGLTWKMSEPYFAGSAQIYWSESTFDKLGRVKSVSTPNVVDGIYNEITTAYIYEGLTTVTIKDENNGGGGVRRNQESSVTKNVFGEVVQTVDANGQILNNTYSANGDLVWVKTSFYDASGSLVQNKELTWIESDKLGRKTKQYNYGVQLAPQSGNEGIRNWEYTYNAFGELIQQKAPSASGSTVRAQTDLTYDLLGRLTSKTVTEGANAYVFSYEFDKPSGLTGKIIGTVARETGPNGYVLEYFYDNLSRVNKVRETNGGQTFETEFSFDSYNRPLATVYPTDYAVYSHYENTLGTLTSVTDSNSKTWWSSAEWDASGRLTQYRLHGGTAMNPVYWRLNRQFAKGSGFLEQAILQEDITSGAILFDQTYAYDNLGNLIQRQDNLRSLVESLRYDDLNRLTGTALQDLDTLSVPANISYDGLGNIKSKPGNTNNYHATQFQQLEWCWQDDGAGGEWLWHEYNGRGELKNRFSQKHNTYSTIVWNPFAQPSSLTEWVPNGQGGYAWTVSYAYQYGSQQQRVYEVYQENGTLTQTKRIVRGGLYENISKSDGSPIEHRHRISLPGGASATWTFNEGQLAGQGTGHYVVGDHLGSSSLVLKLDGTSEEYSYDAWGNPRSVSTWQRYGQTTDWPEYHYNQGFTGHRMLNGMKWIDMNGRLYDPNTGRFLSADPFIQFPGNIQSYNHYTYVLNNPLTFTDPSGYFLSGLFRSIGNFIQKYWKIIVVVVATVFTGGAVGFALAKAGFAAGLGALGQAVVIGAIAGGAAGFAGGLLGGILYGGDALSMAFEGALWGAISGAIAGGLNQLAQSNSWTRLRKAFANGVSTSAVDTARGRSTGAGFFSGFTGAYAGGAFAETWKAVVAGAVLGGAASEIAGEGFESGAVTGAFAAMASSYFSRRTSQGGQSTGNAAPNSSANTTVELRYNPIAKWLKWLGPLAPKHAYLVITDNTTGAQWVTRAGPQGSLWREKGTGGAMGSFWGRVQGEVEIFDSDHIDWDPSPMSSSVILSTNQAAADVVSGLRSFTNNVNFANIPYAAFGFNSNSFAHQAAESLVGQRPMSQAWAPGFDLVLPLP